MATEETTEQVADTSNETVDDAAATQQNEGPAEQSEATPEKGKPTDGGTDNQSDAGESERPKWKYQLKGELQENAELDKYKTLSDAMNDFLEVKRRADEMVSIPGDDADEEAKKAFREKFGVPENPQDYKLPAVEGVKDADTSNIRSIFHEAGLNQPQAEKVFGKIMSEFATEQQQAQQRLKSRVESNTEEIKREWGDNYEANLEKVRQTYAKLGGGEDFAKSLMETGIMYGPDTMRMGLKIADKVLEDDFFAGTPAKGAINQDDPTSWYPKTNFD